MSNWTTNDIPDQTGKLVVITGATGGLGYETALALASKGADVVLTGRNDKKGAEALARIRAVYPAARLSYETLDLGSLKSVAAFAARFVAAHDHLDVLVNNGGVMMPPTRQTTADGFELQFGTNYLSHFALTAQLYAATDPHAENGTYYGPTGLFEIKGAPGKVGMAGKAKDLAVAARLWTVSEQLTGVHYPALSRAA